MNMIDFSSPRSPCGLPGARFGHGNGVQCSLRSMRFPLHRQPPLRAPSPHRTIRNPFKKNCSSPAALRNQPSNSPEAASVAEDPSMDVTCTIAVANSCELVINGILSPDQARTAASIVALYNHYHTRAKNLAEAVPKILEKKPTLQSLVKQDMGGAETLVEALRQRPELSLQRLSAFGDLSVLAQAVAPEVADEVEREMWAQLAKLKAEQEAKRLKGVADTPASVYDLDSEAGKTIGRKETAVKEGKVAEISSAPEGPGSWVAIEEMKKIKEEEDELRIADESAMASGAVWNLVSGPEMRSWKRRLVTAIIEASEVKPEERSEFVLRLKIDSRSADDAAMAITMQATAKGASLTELAAKGLELDTPATRALRNFFVYADGLTETALMRKLEAGCWEQAQLGIGSGSFICKLFLGRSGDEEGAVVVSGRLDEMKVMGLTLALLEGQESLGGVVTSGKQWTPVDGRIQFRRRRRRGSSGSGYEMRVKVEAEKNSKIELECEVPKRYILTLMDCLDVFAQLNPAFALPAPTMAVPPVLNVWHLTRSAVRWVRGWFHKPEAANTDDAGDCSSLQPEHGRQEGGKMASASIT